MTIGNIAVTDPVIPAIEQDPYCLGVTVGDACVNAADFTRPCAAARGAGRWLG